jgi:MtfA peptidase
MLNTLVVLSIIGLIVAGILVTPFLRQQRRQRLKNRPFPPMWQAIVEHHLPIYARLTPAQRRQLQGHIQVFLAEKQFIGCLGLQVTEEMKVTIAAIASLLLLNGRQTYFPKLRSILIYPSAYRVKQTTVTSDLIVEERQITRLGESWIQDQLVLSWAQVEQDIHHWRDGHNVVLHEFAHQLDQEDGRAEGVPILQTASDYSAWSKIMAEEYRQLCDEVARGLSPVIDPYGATDPAEFFAVVTEVFFEQPDALSKRHPALYKQMQCYYQLDPTEWLTSV